MNKQFIRFNHGAFAAVMNFSDLFVGICTDPFVFFRTVMFLVNCVADLLDFETGEVPDGFARHSELTS